RHHVQTTFPEQIEPHFSKMSRTRGHQYRILGTLAEDYRRHWQSGHTLRRYHEGKNDSVGLRPGTPYEVVLIRLLMSFLMCLSAVSIAARAQTTDGGFDKALSPSLASV